jgi:hypothetical protein
VCTECFLSLPTLGKLAAHLRSQHADMDIDLKLLPEGLVECKLCGKVYTSFGVSRHTKRCADPPKPRWNSPALLDPETRALLDNILSGLAPPRTLGELRDVLLRAHMLSYDDDLLTCTVCDEFRFKTAPLPWRAARHVVLAVDSLPPTAYQKLQAPRVLHPDLLAQYNVSHLVDDSLRSHVNELLLSPRGITKDGMAIVCTTCLGSLRNRRMPKFAIANG